MNLPIEIFANIINYLDYIDIVNLNMVCKDFDFYYLVHNLTIHSNNYNKNDDLPKSIDYLNQCIHFCNSISKCNNVRNLVIGNLPFIKNELAMYNLFTVISNYENLHELTVLLDGNVKQAFFYNLLNFNSLHKLTKIKIPYLSIDNFPCSHFECGNILANKVFINLSNINYLNIYVKNNIHQYYLDKINYKTIETLYITSKNTNIFNEYYTQYDDEQQTYVIKRTLLYPNLKKVSLKLDVSDIKTFIYILDPITKNSIEELVLDFKIFGKNRKNLFMGSLFNKINSLPNLKILKIKNLTPFHEIERDDCDVKLTNNLEYISIHFTKKTGRAYLKSSHIQDRIELLNIFTFLKNLKTLEINLYRNKCNSHLIIDKELMNNILPQSLENLIISDINIFEYLALFIEMSCNNCNIKNIKLDNISSFGRKHEKLLDHNYDEFISLCKHLINQNKKLLINKLCINNLISKNENYNEKINYLITNQLISIYD